MSIVCCRSGAGVLAAAADGPVHVLLPATAALAAGHGGRGGRGGAPLPAAQGAAAQGLPAHAAAPAQQRHPHVPHGQLRAAPAARGRPLHLPAQVSGVAVPPAHARRQPDLW